MQRISNEKLTIGRLPLRWLRALSSEIPMTIAQFATRETTNRLKLFFNLQAPNHFHGNKNRHTPKVQFVGSSPPEGKERHKTKDQEEQNRRVGRAQKNGKRAVRVRKVRMAETSSCTSLFSLSSGLVLQLRQRGTRNPCGKRDPNSHCPSWSSGQLKLRICYWRHLLSQGPKRTHKAPKLKNSTR